MRRFLIWFLGGPRRHSQQEQDLHNAVEVMGRMAQQMMQMRLEYARYHKALMEQILIELDNPEHQDEFRAKIILSLRDSADEVARMEEIIT
jgi:hypothetical protein